MKEPGNWTIGGLFAGRPEAFRLFHVVRDFIQSLGPVKMEAGKTQVSFRAKTGFAWVWLPQMWIRKRSQDSITLAFAVGRRIQHERIAEAVEPRPGRWTHHVIIEDEAGLDDVVREWLREAYSFGQEMIPRRASRARHEVEAVPENDKPK